MSIFSLPITILSPLNKAITILITVALLALSISLFIKNKKLQHDLAAFQQLQNQITELESQVTKLKQLEIDHTELERLRAANRDLNRLRNEITQLRNSPAAKGISDAQWNRVLGQNQQLQKERDALIAERERAPMLTCINNLRIIFNAKKQWATEAAQPDTATPTAEQLAPLLPSPFPTCPADGLYDLKPVRDFPTCSITNHLLTAQNF